VATRDVQAFGAELRGKLLAGQITWPSLNRAVRRLMRQVLPPEERSLRSIAQEADGLMVAFRTGVMPGQRPPEPISRFVCSHCSAGETFRIAVGRREPDPPCPRCHQTLHRGAWSKRSERAAKAKAVNSPLCGQELVSLRPADAAIEELAATGGQRTDPW
jgi:hypothetical protein